jgi:hypothetical protein
MKKKNLKSLQLNKKAISNFNNLKGGIESYITSCETASDNGDCPNTFDCGTDDCGNITIGSFCGANTYENEGCPTYTQNLYCPR